MRRAREVIEALGLQKHPEGGWYREVYRAAEAIDAAALPPRFSAPHPFSTSIYFLLAGNEFSALHRIRADELWHFYVGVPLTVHAISPDGSLSQVTLGSYPVYQSVVPAGHWFGAALEDQSPDAFALVGCTVAPGFTFDDLQLANRADLLAEFPQHRAVIERLTRSA